MDKLGGISADDENVPPISLGEEEFVCPPFNILSVTVEQIVTKGEIDHLDNVILFYGSLFGKDSLMVIEADSKESLPELKEGYCILGVWHCCAELSFFRFA